VTTVYNSLLKKAREPADFGHLPKNEKGMPFRISALRDWDLGILPKMPATARSQGVYSV
jgi:hypothetical protein